MWVVLLAALLALANARPGPQTPSRSGAQVLRVVPQTDAQLHYLQGLLSLDLYDFWTEPKMTGRSVDIMVSAWSVPVLKKTLNDIGMGFITMIRDLAQHSAQAKASNKAARAKFFATKDANVKHDMDWTSYHTLDEINGYLDYLATTYPDLCSIENIGTSYEGRTMNMLKISTGGSGKPGLFIDGGIHAREWIAPATVTYAINQLVESGSYQDILDAVDFYIIPSINPDGYVYSWEHDRYWRKTRSNYGTLCYGCDPNRNWSFHWDEIGASDNPCSEIYAGPSPFSEIEMVNVRDAMSAQSNLISYLTFHSYSQLWMYPWGFTTDLPEDWQDLDNLASDAVDALTAVHGTHYEIGSSTNTIYAAAGGSDDWAKGEGGVKYAYTIELRDTGNWGFDLPENQIIPTGEETWAGIEVVARFVATQ
ncbi:unnamed protein product [Meganyctiphanes norvegica]|uniref:Peptidase M14 domain-containing protein n=1 Tax=Meganyctiphanes norvegica TaxID=48144 RepID=A0AAV2QGQ8_MEGNR